MRQLILLSIGVLIAACAAPLGPKPGTVAFNIAVGDALLDQEVIVATQGSWFPDTFGHNEARDFVWEDAENHVGGVFVLTDDAITFLVYDSNRAAFVKAKRILLDDVEDAMTNTRMNSTRLVIVHARGLDSFYLEGGQKLIGNEANFAAIDKVVDAVRNR